VHAEDDEPMLEFEADSDPEQDNSEGRRIHHVTSMEALNPATLVSAVLRTRIRPDQRLFSCQDPKLPDR